MASPIYKSLSDTQMKIRSRRVRVEYEEKRALRTRSEGDTYVRARLSEGNRQER